MQQKKATLGCTQNWLGWHGWAGVAGLAGGQTSCGGASVARLVKSQYGSHVVGLGHQNHTTGYMTHMEHVYAIKKKGAMIPQHLFKYIEWRNLTDILRPTYVIKI